MDRGGYVLGKLDGYFFFFFKQKTAYEVLRSLVGSEMCIRDSPWCGSTVELRGRIESMSAERDR